MTEQIYINGVLMDMEPGKSTSLIFQSPYFTDIDNIVSNRTSSAEFPATPNNLRAVEHANLPTVESRFGFYRHRVVYCRNGLQVFAGSATLLSMQPHSIKMSFTWGNVAVFQKLLDANLRDLQQAADYVPYDAGAAQSNRTYYPTGWNTPYNWGGEEALSVQPMMPVREIMKRVCERYGITLKFPGNTSFDDYYIPLTSRNANTASRSLQGIVIDNAGTVDVVGEFVDSRDNIMPCVMRRLTSISLDLNGLNDQGIIDVSNIDKLIVRAASGFTMKGIKGHEQLLLQSGLRVVATDEDGKFFKSLGTIDMRRTDAGEMFSYRVVSNTEIEIDVSKYDYVCLVICAILGVNNVDLMGKTSVTESAEIKLFNKNLETLTFGKGARFPLYSNLPDWTISQLIKNLMKLEGLFAYAESDTEIRFVTIGALYDNRKLSYDWTDKLMTDEGLPTEYGAQFGNFAQKNLCKYEEDDSVHENFDSFIEVKNETLDAQTDLITLDFAPTTGMKIEVWTKDDDGKYGFNDVEPRILKRQAGSTDGEVSFGGLAWEDVIKSKYYHYQSLVRYLRPLKTTIRIDACELKALDLTVPAYSRQWGHYYGITKLTTKGNNTADVELLQLGRATVFANSDRDEEPEIKPEEDLHLVPNGDGTYHATLSGVTDEELQRYIADDDYHLCIVRYGYARRGKKGRKTDRRAGEVGTHTARSGEYRKYRGKKTWRIIGHDILKRNERLLPGASQTLKSPIYAEATLVLELGETIRLPKMRDRKVILSSRGRIRNTSSSGLGELYLGLYKKVDKKEDYRWGWKCITNRVQLRGLNADHTRYWEFDKSNEKGL